MGFTLLGNNACFCRMKKKYINYIKEFKPTNSSVTKARILLLGPSGVGKSSFVNSVFSIFRNSIGNRAYSAIPTTVVRFSDRTLQNILLEPVWPPVTVNQNSTLFLLPPVSHLRRANRCWGNLPESGHVWHPGPVRGERGGASQWRHHQHHSRSRAQRLPGKL